jgi:hypothetical protein
VESGDTCVVVGSDALPWSLDGTERLCALLGLGQLRPDQELQGTC